MRTDEAAFRAHAEAFRALLTRWWDQRLLGDVPSPAAAQQLRQDGLRLIDKLGPQRAGDLAEQHARKFYEASGRCPLCLQAGIYHDWGAGEICR
jgi:hypothetical protein